MAGNSTVVHVPRGCQGVVALSGVHKPRVMATAGTYREVLEKVRSIRGKSAVRPILLYVPRAQETYVY